MIPELVLLDTEPGAYAFYAWGNVMIACWSTRATGPAIQRIARLRETLDTQHPEGVSVVYLIADGAGLPTPEARAGVKELMERFRHQRACLGIVVYGEGFWASAMRAAITGVQILIRSKVPMRIFSRPEELAEWLPAQHESRTKVRVRPELLLRVLRELTATL